MDTLTLNSKGQITIPASVRKKMGLKEGSEINLNLNTENDLLTLTPTRSILDGFGMLPKPKRAATIEEMDEAIGRAVVEQYRKGL